MLCQGITVLQCYSGSTEASFYERCNLINDKVYVTVYVGVDMQLLYCDNLFNYILFNSLVTHYFTSLSLPNHFCYLVLILWEMETV